MEIIFSVVAVAGIIAGLFWWVVLPDMLRKQKAQLEIASESARFEERKKATKAKETETLDDIASEVTNLQYRFTGVASRANDKAELLNTELDGLKERIQKEEALINFHQGISVQVDKVISGMLQLISGVPLHPEIGRGIRIGQEYLEGIITKSGRSIEASTAEMNILNTHVQAKEEEITLRTEEVSKANLAAANFDKILTENLVVVSDEDEDKE